MGNILLQNIQSQRANNNSILGLAAKARSMGPSGSVFNQLYTSNPQFRQFADSMQGKTPSQAFREHGLDFERFKDLKW